MKKAGICLFLAVLLISATAFGEIIQPIGPGQFGYDAVVISKTVTVRATQNANAKAVKKLSYGDHLAVMSLGNGWCECYLSETDGLSGYVLEDYILIDPSYIVTEEPTAVYAWQARNAKKVGLLGRGETYPIIRAENNWLLISLRGAAGWIIRPEWAYEDPEGATGPGTAAGTTSQNTREDTAGTAHLSQTAVRKMAENYLLATGVWIGGVKVTAATLGNFNVFVNFDETTREWFVTFNSRSGNGYIVIVDDNTGEISNYTPGNG